MHIPMAPPEIARFLGISSWAVTELCEAGQLSRTIGCPYRDNPALNWSSIYDVLEYCFCNGRLSRTLPRAQAALWVYVLAEADEEDGFQTMTHAEQVSMLVKLAVFEGFSSLDLEALQIAQDMLMTRAELLKYCEQEDRKAA